MAAGLTCLSDKKFELIAISGRKGNDQGNFSVIISRLCW